MKLKLANDLSLPLDVVTEKLAWLGRTGSGKTYGAIKLAELMLDAGAQIGALDPVGVWRGLRVPEKKGGTSYDVVVFGGLYGDLPLQPGAGALIADVVCDRGISFVIDVSQFIASEQQRFAKSFAERFFQRRKAAPAACHLFMEECQEFLPQNPMGLEADTLHEFQRLWKIGRNFGIGGSLISQRPQEVNKKALNMSGTLFAFQMTAPQERKAVKDWVADHGIATEIESVLQKLEVGEPHVESPMFLNVSRTVRILPRVTADLSSTPKVGTSKAATRPLTPIDVEQLKSAMAETIERAAADDPRLLRRRIQELEKQVKGMSSTHIPASQPPAPKVVEKPVLKDAQLTKIDALIMRTEKAFDRATKPVEELRSVLKTLNDAVRLVRQPAPAARQVVQPTARHIPVGSGAEAADRPSRATSPAGSNGSLGSGERATLIAAAQYPEGLTREQATILTGYKRSTRDAYIQRLQARGFVDARLGDVYVTQAGIAALGSDFEPLPTGQELQAYWLRRLPEGERAVLEASLRSYPHAVDRESLSESTGYKRSTRDAYIQRLSARKLVVPGHGVVKASDHLFGT
jgi:hypothetical protein